MGTRPPQRVMVTLGEAAARLGVTTKTVRNYIAEGRLTGYRIGTRLLRVDLAEVDGLLKPIPTTRRAR